MTPACHQCDAAARAVRKCLSALAFLLAVRVLSQAPGGWIVGGQWLASAAALVAVLSIVAPALALVVVAVTLAALVLVASHGARDARGAGVRWDPFGPTRLSAPHTPAAGPIAPPPGKRSLESTQRAALEPRTKEVR